MSTASNGYLATYTFHASVDAAGSFVIDVLHDEQNGDQTFLMASFTDKIEVIGTSAAVVNVE